MSDQSKTVLYLSYDGMTDPLGQAQVLPYLEGLSREGFSIHLISFEKRGPFEKNRAKIQQFCAASGIDWLPKSYTKAPPIFSTIWDLSRMYWSAKRALRKYPVGIVHTRSYAAGIVGLRLKRLFDFKLLADIRGFWADERVEGGLWDPSNWLYGRVYRFFKKEEKKLFSHADGIVTLTKASMEYLADHFALSAVTAVIPCAADIDFFRKVDNGEVARLKEELGLKDKYVLTYLGSIGTWYMLDEMLRFFIVLKLIQPNAKFLFLTKDDPKTIHVKAAKLNINVQDISVHAVEREQLPTYLHISNASVFFIRPTFSKSASSPTKHGELLAASIPVVCNAVGDLGEILRQAKTGVQVESFDDDAFHTAAKELLSSTFYGFEGVAAEYYSLAKATEHYLQLYSSLLNEK